MRFVAILIPAFFLLGSCSLLVDFSSEKTATERLCGDEVDNDGDGFIDCADQDCENAEECSTVNNVANPEICDNGSDDDGDGFIDCEDPDCQFEQNCVVGGEICDNGADDDGDGMVDCEDPDCMGSPACDTILEADCGNGYDDDGNGLVDCQDPDCEQSPICLQALRPCNAYVDFVAVGMMHFYYRDIYEAAISESCDQGQICTIKPVFSWVPHCYPAPSPGALSIQFQECGMDKPCGPGMICGPSSTVGSDVCLPLCAPGYLPQCIGGQGICFNNFRNFQDELNSQFMEIWTCDIPLCNPLRPSDGGCTQFEACYPDPSLFGAAACHQVYGVLPAGSPCPTGSDLDCAPGLICRGQDSESLTCRNLCVLGTDCGSNVECLKDDPRQHFGYCE